jgi:hypothetical protein
MNDGIYCLLKKLAGTTRLELATSAVTDSHLTISH